MNDDDLRQILKQTDERFQPAGPVEAASLPRGSAFVAAVRQRRERLVRRRMMLGVLAVLVLVGLSSWSWHDGFRTASDRPNGAVAAHDATKRNGGREANAESRAVRDSRLSDLEVARMKAEIAALEAEANRALQLVELYRAAETRRDRAAATNSVFGDRLLPADVETQLEIDRAAAITVLSADSQANRFNRRDEAAESYRSVLTHFPESRWASVARSRLAQAQQMN
jgi:hypothetical protein